MYCAFLQFSSCNRFFVRNAIEIFSNFAKTVCVSRYYDVCPVFGKTFFLLNFGQEITPRHQTALSRAARLSMMTLNYLSPYSLQDGVTLSQVSSLIIRSCSEALQRLFLDKQHVSQTVVIPKHLLRCEPSHYHFERH